MPRYRMTGRVNVFKTTSDDARATPSRIVTPTLMRFA